MKLSRRGKSARRGRHTKRTGKHLRYRGKKVSGSKRYHRGHKRTHKRGRRLQRGRIKRGGAGNEDGLPVPKAEITEHERELAFSAADVEFERLAELDREYGYGSKPLKEFLTRFDNILEMGKNNPAITARLELIMEYAPKITTEMVANTDHEKRDDNIENILTEYLGRIQVDGVFR